MASFRVLCCAIVVILFCVFQTGESLDCFSCDAKCQTINRTETCSPIRDIKCLSVFDDEGEIVAKGCGTEEHCKVYAHCFSCNEDLCNSGASPPTIPKPNKPCSPNVAVNVKVSV